MRLPCPTLGLVSSGIGYQMPQLSSDLKYLLFQVNHFYLLRKPKITILEIDISTGSELIMCKKCIDPTYSTNSQYVLFKKRWILGDSFYIYGKLIHEYFKLENCSQAFWLKTATFQ
jgi:hypothetical protein